MRSLMMWTGVIVAVMAVVIAGLYFVTRPAESGGGNGVGTPIAPHVVTPANIPSSGRTLGDPNAKVTIDIWEDFRCTVCFDFTMNLQPKLVDAYIKTGKAQLVYHDYLVIDKGDGANASRDAANAAWCAADQGKFWTMHDWLFTNQSPRELAAAFSQDRLIQIGQMAGLDMSKLQPCIQQGTHYADIAAEQKDVPSDASGTPSVYVDGKVISTGNSMDTFYTNITSAIDNALNPSPSASASGSAAPSASASTVPSLSPTAS
jgi:protein-disulfide isomerase